MFLTCTTVYVLIRALPQHASLCVQSIRASSQQSSQCACALIRASSYNAPLRAYAVNKDIIPTCINVYAPERASSQHVPLYVCSSSGHHPNKPCCMYAYRGIIPTCITVCTCCKTATCITVYAPMRASSLQHVPLCVCS